MARKTTKPKLDVYAKVTANIIASIESNPDKLEMPWHRSGLSLNLPSNVLSENSLLAVLSGSAAIPRPVKGARSHPFGATVARLTQAG